MNNTQIIAIIKRFAIALIGYFIVFPFYLVLFLALGGKALSSISLAKVMTATFFTLILPFIDGWHNIKALFLLYRLPASPIEHQPILSTLLRDLRFALGTEVLLLAAAFAAAYLFERSRRKNTRTTMLFYFFAPALLWILWSELYLFV